MAEEISNDHTSTTDDPLLPWLRSVKEALDYKGRETLNSVLENCVIKFKDDDKYRNDIRFLKIWILYADSIQDFESIYKTLEEKEMCLVHALLYMSYAAFLIAKGKLIEADKVYRIGIERNAQPIEELENSHAEFLKRLADLVSGRGLNKVDNAETVKHGKKYINPWSLVTINDLLKKKTGQMTNYSGYFVSTKNYSGKVPMSSVLNSARNKIIEIGGQKYQIKGCAGKGGFAQVFKACLHDRPDDLVAIKIQKPPFPWEFYMYRQLDERISDAERPSFSSANIVHIYSDYSILVCDYIAHGTLQDAINSYVVIGQKMQEVLCIYYTIEMLRMLETLHSVGIIHGDFKPDNLLMRYARADLTVEGFSSRTGHWREQGLCLIDWGRGIDASLFPEGTEFNGDCRTSCFRCIEIQEKRPWKFQQSCGSSVLADGRLADLIRRVATFRMVLMKLDLRQESGRHAETLDAVTTFLDMGVYSEWDEDEKLKFLTRELKGKRPLVPHSIQFSPDIKEVLDSFRVAAELGSDSLGAYVISMASNASDVLAVELLQKDARLAVSGELGRPCPGGT